MLVRADTYLYVSVAAGHPMCATTRRSIDAINTGPANYIGAERMNSHCICCGFRLCRWIVVSGSCHRSVDASDEALSSARALICDHGSAQLPLVSSSAQLIMTVDILAIDARLGRTAMHFEPTAHRCIADARGVHRDRSLTMCCARFVSAACNDIDAAKAERCLRCHGGRSSSCSGTRT